MEKRGIKLYRNLNEGEISKSDVDRICYNDGSMCFVVRVRQPCKRTKREQEDAVLLNSMINRYGITKLMTLAQDTSTEICVDEDNCPSKDVYVDKQSHASTPDDIFRKQEVSQGFLCVASTKK